MSKNIYGWDTSQDSPILANQYSSDENNPENGEEDPNKSFYKRMMDYYKNNNWLQGLTSAAGGIAGAAIGGGYNEGAGGVFSAMQPLAQFLPGPWGAVASVGLGLGQRMFGYKLNKENVNKTQNNINQLATFNSNAGSFDSLMTNYNSAPGRMFFTRKDIGSNGWFNKGATRKYNSLMAQQDWADTRVSAALENNRSNLVNSQYANNLAHFTAYGGPINMATTRPLSPFGNRFNYGGMSALATHGADWNNGLKFINVGGSHEENPYEGVQMGVDQEGTPNLVEEGEVIWNDYVFSNRMVVPKRIKEKLGVKGMNDITYAEAAKKIQKEAEERPNDPISKRGLDATLGRLAYAQEEDRQKKQEEEQQQAIMAAYGGELIADDSEDNEYSDGGKIHIKESKRGTFTKAATEHDMGVQEFANKVLANKDNYSPAMVKKANFAKNASKWHAYGGELGNLFPGDGPYPNLLNLQDPFYTQAYSDAMGLFPPIPDTLIKPKKQQFNGLNPWDFYENDIALGKAVKGKTDEALPGQVANWVTSLYNNKSKYYDKLLGYIYGNDIPAQYKSNPRRLISDAGLAANRNIYNSIMAAHGNPVLGTDKKPAYIVNKEGKEIPNYNIGNFRRKTWEADLYNNSYNFPFPPLLNLKPNLPPLPKYVDFKKNGIKPADNTKDKNNGESFWDKAAGYLRYAPVIGSAINVFTDLVGLTNKPDYSNADSLTAATQNLRDVRPPSIGDYVRYTPFDRMFYLNQLNANAGATRRGLMDIAGGNRGAAMAGLLASDYNTLGKIGELARQAEEYNLANRFKSAEFNRGTNQFNSEMDLKAQMANNQNASVKLDVLSKAAAIRDAIDARIGAARSANLTGLFDNLGAIGEDYINRKERDMLIRSGVFGTLSERPYGWDDKDWNTYKELLKKYNRGNSRE